MIEKFSKLLNSNKASKLAKAGLFSSVFSCAAISDASCDFSYLTNWNGGYIGQIVYTNETSTAMSDWQIYAAFNSMQVVSAWGDTIWSGSNPAQFSPIPSQPALAPGQSRNIYFVANTSSGSQVSAPTLSGEVCGIASSSEGLASLTQETLGVVVSVDGGTDDFLGNNKRKALAKENFDQLVVENSMGMSYWDSSTYYNPAVDQLSDWIRANGLSLHGNKLVWHSCYQLPSWSNDIVNYQQNYVNHVRGVASQYKDLIDSWDVVTEALFDASDDFNAAGCNYQSGGANVDGVTYRKSSHYLALGKQYISLAFDHAKQVAPEADLYYKDFYLHQNQSKTNNLIKMLSQLKAQGVPVDGVNFSMAVLPSFPSIDNIKTAWQKVVDLGLKVKVTDLEVRINNPYDGVSSNDVSSCDGCAELSQQAQRYKDVIDAYFDVVPTALRGGITFAGFIDSDSWFYSDPDWTMMWDSNFQSKPALQAVADSLSNNN